VTHRVGFVGTLDHPPTHEGLALMLPQLAKIATPGIRVRLVGGPAHLGRLWQERFPLVEYLGQLDEDGLEREAATWACFAQPLFCYARGCSTKLATAIGWRIPVVTTPAGCRGYVWTEGGPELVDTPAGVAMAVATLASDATARDRARAAVERAALTAPTAADVAMVIRHSLRHLIPEFSHT
jgi:hypothetical protein